jgi:hypothetical protein
VWLTPGAGACRANGATLRERTELAQGMTLHLGPGNVFRFNHPWQAVRLKEERERRRREGGAAADADDDGDFAADDLDDEARAAADAAAAAKQAESDERVRALEQALAAKVPLGRVAWWFFFKKTKKNQHARGGNRTRSWRRRRSANCSVAPRACCACWSWFSPMKMT